MDYELDELFTGNPTKSPSKPTGTKSTPKQKPKAKPPVRPTVTPSEGSDIRVKPKSDDPTIARPQCSGVLETVEKACGGNRYLEGMILGEILNSPRCRKPYGK